MATIPTPVPAPVVPSAILSPTRRQTTRSAPPTRVVYTRHATAGDSDDRIISNALNVFYKFMAWGGGVAILIWILFGGFKLGRATASIGSISSASAPRVIERVIEMPDPMPPAAVVQQPSSRGELTPEGRAEQYKEERRRQYSIR